MLKGGKKTWNVKNKTCEISKEKNYKLDKIDYLANLSSYLSLKCAKLADSFFLSGVRLSNELLIIRKF